MKLGQDNTDALYYLTLSMSLGPNIPRECKRIHIFADQGEQFYYNCGHVSTVY